MGKGIVKLGEGNWAVKDGNLLAAKETNGRFKNAEFTVTRGTDATYVGRDGLIVNETGDNTPRIDFTDNTDGHLLLEPQSTNLLPYSEDFSESVWTKNTGVTLESNYGISPDGNKNSTKVTFANSNIEMSYTVTTGDETTGSMYVKGVEGETIKFGTKLSEEVFTLNGNWQRFEKTGSVENNNKITINTYSGATAREIEVWGAQLEELPYATSYIPTNGSTVTRDAETCTGAGEAADFNSEEGVLYAEISTFDDGLTKRISLNNGTTSSRVIFQYNPTLSIIKYFYVNTTNQCVLEHTLTDITNFSKIALKWKQNDFALWVDGVERDSDNSGNVLSANTLTTLDFDGTTDSYPFYGKCKAIRVYKETDGIDLGTLTSL